MDYIKCLYNLIINASPLTVSAISHFAVAVMALINIIIVIMLYISDRRIKGEDKKINWYRKIVLDRNINLVDEFFFTNIKIIIDCQNKNNDTSISKDEFVKFIKQQNGNYTDSKMKLSHNFVDLISIINKEKGQALDNLIEKFQDDFSNYLTSFFLLGEKGYDFDNFNRLVYNQKKEFLSQLYAFEINGFK